MADTDQFDEEAADFVDGPEMAIESQLAASSLGPLSHRQESIAQMLVEDTNLEKLTNFPNFLTAIQYAKMEYLWDVAQAAGRDDGFVWPDMKENLMRRDYQLRTSAKQQT